MILLDTHVLIYLLFSPARLGGQTRQVIGSEWPVGYVAVSAITFWEVAMLHDKGMRLIRIFPITPVRSRPRGLPSPQEVSPATPLYAKQQHEEGHNWHLACCPTNLNAYRPKAAKVPRGSLRFART